MSLPKPNLTVALHYLGFLQLALLQNLEQRIAGSSFKQQQHVECVAVGRAQVSPAETKHSRPLQPGGEIQFLINNINPDSGISACSALTSGYTAVCARIAQPSSYDRTRGLLQRV